ncbi:hypothetical protein OESDEN_14667 [Oesophagostomum dentatum]|uniref:Uncharacterized protein n=1 Tax=Oesophagostomum dentatum TaxID=61180 RepID=A0A0B1SQ35_OESDE|nr:hypothetical protein OESDEN_23670 [Oesophagostomum dentatum]KHJ85602.1 hypothetical protein OESDEN_14667 [Oesophagostomum dentatum]
MSILVKNVANIGARRFILEAMSQGVLASMPVVQSRGITDMALRRQSGRRGSRRSLREHLERRRARSFHFEEDKFALLPPVNKGSTEKHCFKVPYPRDIVKYLDKFVIGQDLAKRTLAVGIYQHYKRLENNTEIKNVSLAFCLL